MVRVAKDMLPHTVASTVTLTGIVNNVISLVVIARRPASIAPLTQVPFV